MLKEQQAIQHTTRLFDIGANLLIQCVVNKVEITPEKAADLALQYGEAFSKNVQARSQAHEQNRNS